MFFEAKAFGHKYYQTLHSYFYLMLPLGMCMTWLKSTFGCNATDCNISEYLLRFTP